LTTLNGSGRIQIAGDPFSNKSAGAFPRLELGLRRLRLLLCDDHALILEGLKAVLEQRHDIVGLVYDGRSCVQAAQRLNPDVVIIDIGMPILNGIDAAQEIRKIVPSAKLVFLTMYCNSAYMRKAVEAGGSGYVLKSGTARELLRAIEETANGGSYLSPQLGARVFEGNAVLSVGAPRVAQQLTPKQRQVLQLIAEGKQNKEMAGILSISIKTIEFHRARLLRRVGVRSVAELIRFAIEEAIIVPPPEETRAFDADFKLQAAEAMRTS
jgi:DNA-binding NarL/FixJ family response regulator